MLHIRYDSPIGVGNFNVTYEPWLCVEVLCLSFSLHVNDSGWPPLHFLFFCLSISSSGSAFLLFFTVFTSVPPSDPCVLRFFMSFKDSSVVSRSRSSAICRLICGLMAPDTKQASRCVSFMSNSKSGTGHSKSLENNLTILSASFSTMPVATSSPSGNCCSSVLL